MKLLRSLIFLIICYVLGFVLGMGIALVLTPLFTINLYEWIPWITASLFSIVPAARCFLSLVLVNLFSGGILKTVITIVTICLVIQGPVCNVIYNLSVVIEVFLHFGKNYLDKQTLLAQTMFLPLIRKLKEIKDENVFLQREFQVLQSYFQGSLLNVTGDVVGQMDFTTSNQMSRTFVEKVKIKCEEKTTEWMESCHSDHLMGACLQTFARVPVIGFFGSIGTVMNMLFSTNEEGMGQKASVWYEPCRTILNRVCQVPAGMCSNVPVNAGQAGSLFQKTFSSMDSMKGNVSSEFPNIRINEMAWKLTELDSVADLLRLLSSHHIRLIFFWLTVVYSFVPLCESGIKAFYFVVRYVRDPLYHNRYVTSTLAKMDSSSPSPVLPLKRSEAALLTTKTSLLKKLCYSISRNYLLLGELCLKVAGITLLFLLEDFTEELVESLEVLFGSSVHQGIFVQSITVHGKSPLARMLRYAFTPLNFNEHFVKVIGLTGKPSKPSCTGLVFRIAAYSVVLSIIFSEIPRDLRIRIRTAVCNFFHPKQSQKRAQVLLSVLDQSRASLTELKKQSAQETCDFLESSEVQFAEIGSGPSPVARICKAVCDFWPCKPVTVCTNWLNDVVHGRPVPICYVCFQISAVSKCSCGLVPLCEECHVDLVGKCPRCLPPESTAEAEIPEAI